MLSESFHVSYQVGRSEHHIGRVVSIKYPFLMPKRISIKPYLSIEELDQRYRQAKEVIERSHYQIIWLLAQGKRTEEVVEVTGYSRNWIYELVRGGVRSVWEIGGKRIQAGRHCSMMSSKPCYCKCSEELHRMGDYGMDAK